jgi:N-acetylglucosamine malate deacetylase 1
VKVLIIGAHPDDETFGMGGTLAKHIANHDHVFVLILTDGVTARHGNTTRQREAFIRAMKIYGVWEYKHLEYPDQLLDTIPLLKIVRDIETVINEFKPERIYTHAREDIGQDHRRVYEATMIAARPLRDTSVKTILSYPCPSSTYWGETPFQGNYFVDISEHCKTKLQVLTDAYPHEVPTRPHSRSFESISNQETLHGEMMGISSRLEAFHLVRHIDD